MRSLIVVVLLARLALPGAAAAQVPGPSDGRGRVSGVVRDSLRGGAPLAGARVQLVPSDDRPQDARSADTDKAGMFSIGDVPHGRYLIGFLHPLLDSLGLEPTARAVVIDGARAVEVQLTTPSPARLRSTVCGGQASGAAPALVMGIVRRAADRAAAQGAAVTAEWFDIAIRMASVGHRRSSANDTTATNGWYALCGVPQQGTVVLSARKGDSSTDRIEVEVTASGFARRDLYLGEVRMEPVPAPADIASDIDSAAGPVQRRFGDGALRGIVVAGEGQRPIANAQVSVAGSDVATSSATGEWSLARLPTGTRNLEVRSVGHQPRRIAVDVIPGAEPLRVALTTTGATLDTIRVTASRLRLEGTGFDERRRIGMGRYFTAEDFIRRGLIYTSDLFLSMSGIRMDRSSLGEMHLRMRGIFGACTPHVYINGSHMRGFSASDIDSFVSPREIAAIEVYHGTSVPPEFQPEVNGCGSIVIWTAPAVSAVQHWSWKRRVLTGLTAIAVGVGIGTLFSGM